MSLFLAAALLALHQDAAPLEAVVDPLVAPWADGTFSPGFVVGVLRGDDVLVRGYGATAPGSGVVPGPGTIYEIGSLTKLYVGLLLADAELAGVARRDDPLSVHLPEGATVPAFEGAPIRLVHLSTHTSGLTRLPSNLVASGPDPYAAYDAAALLEGLAAARVQQAPGTRYAYSNFAAGALGYALQRAHGAATFEALLLERLCEPLGLDDTRIALDDEQAARLAPPCDGALLPANGWHFDALAGAGAVRASMADLLAFTRLFMADAEGTLAEAALLARAVHARPEAGPSMALGWHVLEGGAGRPTLLAHEGETGGYHSVLLLDVVGRRAVALLANAPTQVLGALTQDVLRAVCGQDVPPHAPAPVLPLPAGALDELPGTYRVGLLDKVVLTARDGALLSQRSRGPRVRLHPVGPDRFEYRTYPGTVEVLRDESGAVTGLALAAGGARVEARRLP